ncbi:MAG: 2-phospho-L-lactate transferase [Candidatus Kariarchaeaceae archaeon]|jgi:LPPG:FO 2-phospho-L-lactate transferase
MKYAFLSGGTGTPKLLQGFRQLVSDEDIGVICNNGDDYHWNGLYICPDLDTVLYQFSEKLDLNKFWGVENETFESLEILKSLYAEDTWFNVGDKDLALHVYRTHLLNTKSLTEVTHSIRDSWDIKAHIVPMSNQPLQTQILSGENNYHFQEFFVKHKTEVDVTEVKFIGQNEETTNDVKEILDNCQQIIIGPSNPVTSIGPILAIEEIHQLLHKYKEKVILVSPIIGDRAFSGPTVKLMKAMNIAPSPIGIASFYEEFVSKIIFDETDKSIIDDISSFNVEPIFHSIELSTKEQKKKLASTILDFM